MNQDFVEGYAQGYWDRGWQDESMANEKLSPERAVRLLRAKAGELEARLLSNPQLDIVDEVMADVALVYSLLADHIERVEAQDG